jgi:hypothetical protein
MNPRIRELWDEAAKVIDSDRDPYSWESQTRFMEQFAQLIVRECIDIANDTRYDGKVVANRIKFVFGVDE